MSSANVGKEDDKIAMNIHTTNGIVGTDNDENVQQSNTLLSPVNGAFQLKSTTPLSPNTDSKLKPTFLPMNNQINMLASNPGPQMAPNGSFTPLLPYGSQSPAVPMNPQAARVAIGLLGNGSPQLHPVLQQIDALNKIYPGSNMVSLLATGKTPPGPAAATVDLTEQEEIGKMKDDGLEESVSTEVFSKYIHREVVPGCLPHPGDIVEAGPLAELLPPDPTYPLVEGITSSVVTSGKLSSLQLEGVLYACQRHQMILPNGRRAGFFIGDAAGVGKGRQIAGIVLDNFSRKRTKHIWFSISNDLIVDAKRDLADLGCHVRVIDGCQELDKETRVLGLPADFKEGVIFSTYATLVSSVQRGGYFSSGKSSRLNQIVKWCGGEEFEGCLIFDECHKAKNFIPGKENNSTKVALAVATIQKLLPKARVVYCSATGVTDVKNMAFMERLGLWGEGAPFKTFEGFLDTIHKKGLGMAEMLAMEMKMSGMYVSRGLSYKQAEFMTVEAQLTSDQRKVYDVATHVWYELRKALESALVRCNSSNNRMWGQYWSAHQRFFKQLCMGMKVPCIVKEAKEALESGHCVVIGLQTTGEASLGSELTKKGGNLTGFMSLCREILTRFITDYFPTLIETKIAGVEPKVDDWSKTAKEMLLGFANKIDLPNSPLDEIIDELGGPSRVAEMTGRRGRIVRHSPTEPPKYELRSADLDSTSGIDSLNVQERNLFMKGKKLVAIISDAASTGISLHADLRVENQCRRVHLTVELPWSADKAVQQLGRSHRSNQSSGPIYKLLTTDLGGERRFAASVAKRLQSMGALTKGDRRAATGADLGEFNFDTPYGRNSLRSLYQHTCSKKLVPGIDLKKITEKYNFDQFLPIIQESMILMGVADVENIKLGASIKDSDAGDVSKFLNRILGLTVEKQNLMFSYFTEILKMTIHHARSEGRYNEGMLDITATSVEMVGQPKEIFKQINKGHTKTRLIELKVDRGMTWDMAVSRFENHSGPNDGFYISKREMWGRKLILLATRTDNSSHLFRISRPNTGLSIFEEEKTELFHKYVPMSKEKAEPLWKELYKQSEDQCIHGNTCKHKTTCRVGSRCYRMHLLCGSIVSHMSLLEATLSKFAPKLNLSKSEANIRVVRVKLDNNERVVGVRYPELLVRQVEKVLTAQIQASGTGTCSSPYFSGSSQPSSSPNPLTPNIKASKPASVASIPSTPTGIKIKTEPGLDFSPSTSQSINFSPPSSQENCSSPCSQRAGEGTSGNVCIEPIAPVCLKSQKRAFRPPVTIKNFFKLAPATVQSVSESDSNKADIAVTQKVNDKDNVCIIDTDKQTMGGSNDNGDKLVMCGGSSAKQIISQGSKGRTSAQKDKSISGNKRCLTITEFVNDTQTNVFHVPGEIPVIFKGCINEVWDIISGQGLASAENKLVELWKAANKCHDNIPKFTIEAFENGCQNCGVNNKDLSNEDPSESRRMTRSQRKARKRLETEDPTSLPASKRRKVVPNTKSPSSSKKSQIADENHSVSSAGPEDQMAKDHVTLSSKQNTDEQMAKDHVTLSSNTNSESAEKKSLSSPLPNTLKNSSNSPMLSTKKHKQCNIMNSFAKAVPKEKKDVTLVTCPICQMKFDAGTSNEDINKHIDNCLIE